MNLLTKPFLQNVLTKRGERKRPREREREREREKEREREREREKERERERQTDRQTGRQRGRQTDSDRGERERRRWRVMGKALRMKGFATDIEISKLKNKRITLERTKEFFLC